MKGWTVILLFALTMCGCAGTKLNAGLQESDAIKAISPEAKTIAIDTELLQECGLPKKLSSGEEDAVVDWSKNTLADMYDCRKRQNKLVKWVKDTFRIK